MANKEPEMREKVRAFLDDMRDCPEGCVLWRSYDEAVAWMTQHGCPDFVSFDHDLGWYVTIEPSPNDDKSGLDVARWMIERDRDGGFFPQDFSFAVHSMNPVGRERILAELSDYLETRALTNG